MKNIGYHVQSGSLLSGNALLSLRVINFKRLSVYLLTLGDYRVNQRGCTNGFTSMFGKHAIVRFLHRTVLEGLLC